MIPRQIRKDRKNSWSINPVDASTEEEDWVEWQDPVKQGLEGPQKLNHEAEDCL
jgi:hypothetical protein